MASPAAATPPPPPSGITGAPGAMEVHLPSECRDQLGTILNSTAQRLEAIWNEVGFSETERRVQVDALIKEVERLCEEKVADEEAVRDTFLSSIAENKDKVLDCARRLNEEPPDLEHDEEGALMSSFALTEQLVHYEHVVAKLEEKIVFQTEKFRELRDQLLQICDEMEDDLAPEWQDITADLSDRHMAEYQEQVTAMLESKTQRITEVVKVVVTCQELLKEMDINSSAELDCQILGGVDDGSLVSMKPTASCPGIGSPNLARLQDRAQELAAEREHRANYLFDIGEKLTALWQLLQLPVEEQEAFEKNLTDGLTEKTIQTGEKELERLEALKLEKIKEIIEMKRSVIAGLWDETSYPNHLREAFAAIRVPEEGFTDDLLNQHEKHIAVLQQRLSKMQPILKNVKKYEEAYDARAQLEELQKDKDRFKGRNSAAQFKSEEQMNKKGKTIPKLKEQIQKQLKDWLASEDEPFMYSNMSCEDWLNTREEDWRLLKESKKKPKISDAGSGGFTPVAPVPVGRQGKPRKRTSTKQADQENLAASNTD